MNTSNSKIPRIIFAILIFFAVVLFFTLLKIMDSVFKPLTLAVLLSFVFYPPIKKLNTFTKLPWWLSTLIIYLSFFVIIFVAVTILSASFKSIAYSVPKYQEKFQTILDSINSSSAVQPDSKLYLLLNFNEQKSIFFNLLQQFNLPDFLKTTALDFTGSIVNFFESLFLVILMSVFLLAEFKKTKQKVSIAFNSTDNEKIIHVVQKIITQTTRYASLKFVISLITGLLVWAGCFAAGLEFPLIWGFTAFCFNFIPTFGSIISSAVIILFSIIQFYPSCLTVILLGLWVTAVNFILGNIIEPKIEGDNLGLSPFIILVALTFASWLWGVLGLFLAVPLMVVIKIICENISFLKPAAVFLGN